MREIKFRALFKKPNGETKWFYYGAQEKPKAPAEYTYVLVQNLQYVSSDRKRQGIYVGDIVKDPSGDIWEVESVDSFFYTVYGYGFNPDDLTVLGNIYEDLELLKGEQG